MTGLQCFIWGGDHCIVHHPQVPGQPALKQVEHFANNLGWESAVSPDAFLHHST